MTRSRALPFVFLFLAGISQAEPKPPAGELRLSIPRAERTLEAHAEAIEGQIPKTGLGVPGIQFDNRVRTDRTLDWGAEGPYWDVVRSFMQASGLDVVDTWACTVHLGIGPSPYRFVDTSLECLVGFRMVSQPGVEPQVIDLEVVGPPWKDVSWTVPEVKAEPDVEVKLKSTEAEIPAGTRRLVITWTLIERTKYSLEQVPLEVGTTTPIPGTKGSIRVDAVRTLPNGNLGVSWTPKDLDLCEHGLLLEDGTFVTPDSGPGWYSKGEREFAPTTSKAVAIRVKVVRESVRKPMKLELDAAAWGADPRSTRAPLAGTIRWAQPPEKKEVLVQGILSARPPPTPARIYVTFGDEAGAEPRSVSSEFTSVALAWLDGGQVAYRVEGLDAGRYTFWLRVGNWIETRKVSIPGEPRKEDFTFDEAESAELRVTVPGDGPPYLVLEPGRGEDGRVRHLEDLRIACEIGTGDYFVAKGLKPGNYAVIRAGRAQKVQLKKGINSVDLVPPARADGAEATEKAIASYLEAFLDHKGHPVADPFRDEFLKSPDAVELFLEVSLAHPRIANVGEFWEFSEAAHHAFEKRRADLVEPVRGLLQDADPLRAGYGALLARRFEMGPELATELVALLCREDGADQWVRNDALKGVQDPAVIADLIEKARERGHEGWGALQAMCCIDTPETHACLRGVVLDKSADPARRKLAVQGLAPLQGPDDIAAATALLADPEEDLATCALLAFVNSQVAPDPDVLRKARPHISENCVEHVDELLCMGGDEDALRRMFEMENYATAARFPGPAKFPLAVEALRSVEDTLQRREILRLLADSDDPGHFELILAPLANSDDWMSSAEALAAYARRRPKELEPVIRRILKMRNVQEQGFSHFTQRWLEDSPDEKRRGHVIGMLVRLLEEFKDANGPRRALASGLWAATDQMLGTEQKDVARWKAWWAEEQRRNQPD